MPASSEHKTTNTAMNLSPTPLVTGFFANVKRLVAPLLVASALSAPAADASARPNIIFILVDDLRWDALSCMGHPVAKTPNIDRIAREGVLFRNFFVSIPL